MRKFERHLDMFQCASIETWAPGFSPPAWVRTGQTVTLQPGDTVEDMHRVVAKELERKPEEVRFVFWYGDGIFPLS